MKISEIKSDTFDIVILVIALEINYQLGRKFTNHNTMADRSSKRSQSAECFIESWIKSMREIESSSHDAFNIERCLASGISNNRERSSKAVIYEVHRSENRVNRFCEGGTRGRGGREPCLLATLPPVRGNNINPTLAGCTMHILRYIIFIIRARDTRSRAWVYNTPVSVNRI